MDTVDITIIGAGVVGLAVAARLARPGRTVLVVEKNPGFGRETSSRSSEVIHSGIYYPKNSLKARLCVAGNALLYDYCSREGIPHAAPGKIVIASTGEERERLEALKRNGGENGVSGLQLIGAEELKKREPEVAARAGLFVPSTGIVDTHALMQRLLAQAREGGALIAFDTEVSAITKTTAGFTVRTKREGFAFETALLVNCAGLHADRIASFCGIDPDTARYRLHYCKGEYFRLRGPLRGRALIYPVPDEKMHVLGVHLTRDLAGGVRFGPNAFYVGDLDYSVDEKRRDEFWRDVRRYLPGISPEDLSPDTSGIRPKLQGPGDGFRDFVIRREADRGLAALVNLIGIESPGLTSCLAIAEYVEGLL
ncbi:MAG: NAD(P)/FAD-dependent oxidoreductase [Endomicrobiales bacterium]